MGSWIFLLKNAGLLMSTFSQFEEIIGRVVKSERKLPSTADVQRTMDLVKRLIDAKVIDIPDVDDAVVFAQFQALVMNLLTAVDGGHRNIDRFGDAKPRFAAPKELVDAVAAAESIAVEPELELALDKEDVKK